MGSDSDSIPSDYQNLQTDFSQPPEAAFEMALETRKDRFSKGDVEAQQEFCLNLVQYYENCLDISVNIFQRGFTNRQEGFENS